MPCSGSLICGQCLQHPPSYCRCYVPFLYKRPISDDIRRWKFKHRAGPIIHFIEELTDLLVNHHFDQIVAVPSHWTRLIWRGGNQAEALAHILGRTLSTPVRRTLIKSKRVKSQKDLERKARLQNLKGAFQVNSNQSIKGLNILLVDDVITTGATAEAASRVLIAAGAQSVSLACLARTPLNR